MRRRILNAMKRLEFVLEADQVEAVCAIVCRHATGYTVVPQVTGLGHHGRHEDGLVLLVTVVTRDHVDPILDQVLPLLNRRSGVVLLSDVQVPSGEYFVPELKDAAADRR
jgi:hypothetical protein